MAARLSVLTESYALGQFHRWLALSGTLAGWLSGIPSSILPPSCVPSLHGRYPLRRYYGRSDSRPSDAQTLCPTHPPARTGLPDYCRPTSNHSVSNHLRVVRDSPRCDRSFLSPQASSFASRLAHSRRPNRVHGGCLPGQPVLRTGRSRSVALHVALLGRSYGSIPHGSSPHRSGLPPLCLLAFSGALAPTFLSAGNGDFPVASSLGTRGRRAKPGGTGTRNWKVP